MHPLFSNPEVFLPASDIAQLCRKSFSKNSDLNDSGFFTYFSSKTKLNLLISQTTKLVKKVINNLGLLEASSLDCILVVVLKNYEAQLSYVLADLFNKCLKESFFSADC